MIHLDCGHLLLNIFLVLVHPSATFLALYHLQQSSTNTVRAILGGVDDVLSLVSRHIK